MEKLVAYYDDSLGWGCWSFNEENLEESKKQEIESFFRWFDHFKNSDDKAFREYCRYNCRMHHQHIKTMCLMDKEEFYKKHNDFYLLRNPVQVTEDEYYEALEVLPPLRMSSRGFQMSERETTTITREYYKEDGKYFYHYVDLCNRESWKM